MYAKHGFNRRVPRRNIKKISTNTAKRRLLALRAIFLGILAAHRLTQARKLVPLRAVSLSLTRLAKLRLILVWVSGSLTRARPDQPKPPIPPR